MAASYQEIDERFQFREKIGEKDFSRFEALELKAEAYEKALINISRMLSTGNEIEMIQSHIETVLERTKEWN